MTPTALFKSAVQGCTQLPTAVRDLAEHATAIEESQFDTSYIEFLDGQIDLCPRGPAWNEILIRRRNAMAPYCGRPYVRGRIQTPSGDYSVNVDVQSGCVFHWECYDKNDAI